LFAFVKPKLQPRRSLWLPHTTVAFDVDDRFGADGKFGADGVHALPADGSSAELEKFLAAWRELRFVTIRVHWWLPFRPVLG
jgi:hypothetical protein